jgi:ATP-dependent RNA helicase DeaD
MEEEFIMTDEQNMQENTAGEAQAEGSQTATLPEYQMDNLPAPLREGFQKLGWAGLMPVQARAIPYILANRDVMIQSRTGSGKTGAYLVPLLQRIDPSLNATQALVLVPTRELATQVIHEAEALGSGMDARTVAVYGGVGYGPQLDAFRKGAHLVVGTPGRILDHLLRRSLTLDDLKILVFDEADRMLSMGFYPDMKRVQRYLPRSPINSYMFSATFPQTVLALSREFMRSPDFLNLSSDHVHVTEVQHVYYNVPPMDKERSLIRIIEVENPGEAIVFCNRRERVHFVATILQRYGYNAAEISSDLSQSAREEVMRKIREGTLRFLVATDVASRGIDIPELTHVIMYEAPEDPESYIHRAGRTGRAGASGVAISLVNSLEKAELMRVGKRFDIDFQERSLPNDDDVRDVVAQRTEALLEARLRDRDRLQAERMQRFIPFLKEIAQDEEALAGVASLLDDFYHENFHTSQTPQPEGKPPAEEPRGGFQGRDRNPARERAPRREREQRSGDRDQGRSQRPGEGGRGRGEGPGAERQTPRQQAPRPAEGTEAAGGEGQSSNARRRRRNRGGGASQGGGGASQGGGGTNQGGGGTNQGGGGTNQGVGGAE